MRGDLVVIPHPLYALHSQVTAKSPTQVGRNMYVGYMNGMLSVSGHSFPNDWECVCVCMHNNVQLKLHLPVNDAVLDKFQGGGGMSPVPSPLLAQCTPALWMVSIPDTLLSYFASLTTLSRTILTTRETEYTLYV